MKRKILTVAAHPDDEILGCGGTMARLSEEGHEVRTLILAEGATSRDHVRNRGERQSDLTKLGEAATQAAEALGVESVELFDLPDNRMDSIDLLDVVKRIEEKIDQYQPDTVFTHFSADLNIDHRIVNDAVVTACRPQPGQVVKEILLFEVPSATDYQIVAGRAPFTPNLFFALSDSQFRKKMEAIRHYAGEMRPFPHARSEQSIEALAAVRGSQVGVPRAEAFMVGRILI